MKHTKEPWCVIGVDNSYEIFSKSEDYDVAWSIDSIANAQRIVACVNACEGINDVVIEEGIIKKALVAYLGTYDRNATWNGMKVWEDV
jgi:hypothetical protein